MLALPRLTRRYGDLIALNDLSFTVAEDQMFGFVGPNGPARPPPCGSCSGAGGRRREVRWCGQQMNADCTIT
jgi:ABC-2 type transport system ATP-binding protein